MSRFTMNYAIGTTTWLSSLSGLRKARISYDLIGDPARLSQTAQKRSVHRRRIIPDGVFPCKKHPRGSGRHGHSLIAGRNDGRS